jgi:glutathione-regulated potassium-efflux system protein KefB
MLMGLGMPRPEAERTIRTFRDHDERRLFEHYTHHNDLEKMQDLAKAGNKELEEMFERDAAETQAVADAAPSVQGRPFPFG